jgi:DNA-directed RNA polymerase beta subunit
MTRVLSEIECGKIKRKTFSKIKDAIDIPYLVKIQKDSYDAFIREGIGEVLEDFSDDVEQPTSTDDDTNKQ